MLMRNTLSVHVDEAKSSIRSQKGKHFPRISENVVLLEQKIRAVSILFPLQKCDN